MKDIIYKIITVSNVTKTVRHAHHTVDVLPASLKITNLMSFKDVQDAIKDSMNRMNNVYHNVVMVLKLMMSNVMMGTLVH